ncbi:MAG: response regulator, partial [Bacteroidota bacterium]
MKKSITLKEDGMVKQKVLIVEDDMIIANFIKSKLEDMGFNVLDKIRTGEEALEKTSRLSPDLILMDVILPGKIDGIYCVEQIRKYLDIPVVYLTASSDSETIERLMKTEPNGFLIKPFDERVLASAIQIAIFRHKTKKELLQAKEALRTTIESIDDMVFGLSTNGNFVQTFPKEKYERFDCFHHVKIFGKNIEDVFPPKISEGMIRCIQKVLESQKSQNFEFSLMNENNLFWFNAKFTIRKNEKSKVDGLTMVVSDITSDKVIHDELLVSQEKLTEAQNIAKLGNCDIYFHEKQYVYNDIFFEILDIQNPGEKNAFTEESMMQIIHPDDRNRYRLYRKKLIADHRNDFSIDFRIIDKSSQIRYIHSAGKIFYDNQNQPTRMIMTIQDVSWQKKNEKIIHDMEIVRKTTDMKQRFFAKLSHEIRNPIGGIVGLLHLIEKTDLSETQKDYLEALKTSSDTLLSLVNDVLDFTKIESGMMKVKNTTFNIREIIKNLSIFFSAKVDQTNIKVCFEIDDRIPNYITADENKIVQVISNLFTNAIKYTNKGHIKIIANLLKQYKDGFTLEIKVEDTGIGISDIDQQKLFKEFTQLENQNTGAYKGTGLGLSISKQLVELMDGEIFLASEPDKGSTFTFHIPVRNADPEQIKEHTVEIAKNNQLKLSVLLVEDMKVNQKVIKLMLEEIGCRVDLASNGAEAIEMLKESKVSAFDIFPDMHYDVILMDHQMPVMDGVTALHHLKKDLDNLPVIIVLTADESFAHDNKYRLEGFDDYLIKPVKPNHLIETLTKWKEKIDAGKDHQKLKLFTKQDINAKPVINKSTINHILKTAQESRFDVQKLFDSFMADMEVIYEKTLTALEMNDYNALNLIVLSIKGLS